MTSHFKVLLSFTHKEGGGGVYYKHDGERFSQPHTLKLNQNTDYTVAVQSPLILRDMMIHGERFEVKEVEPEKRHSAEDFRKFSATFNTTGYMVEKRNKRKDIAVALMFDGDVTLTVVLQCKFYQQTETEHSSWGTSLTWIEYDCTLTEGETGVLVKKEQYV
ncbi:CB1 cannabinoid receptor-interacting protein 1-like [Ostrea edulis]|uniref:CB1 cannabinoid receptor-interacting protein 1-like n=1 Tax=Ostrea edulis TaxID=37623 RepID=UPI0024AF0A9E|nr:CB1 cannabinoid receptor-interacting protein 1-like [Ostrea edulis]